MVDGQSTVVHNDRYSTWSLVLIAALLITSLVQNNFEDGITAAFSKHKSVATAAITTTDFTKLIQIDGEVKEAYAYDYIERSALSSLGPIVASSTPKSSFGGMPLSMFHSGIEKALHDAIDAERSTPDSIYFARRVMLLRSILKIPPLEAIPPTRSHAGISSPLVSFELTAKEYPEIAPQAREQEAFWRSIFTTDQLPKSELQSKLEVLRQHPTLLYYNLIASQYLYAAAGEPVPAARLENYLRYRALISVSVLALLSFVIFGLLFAGLGIWIWAIGAIPRYQARQNGTATEAELLPDAFDRFIIPKPELIANADRKLRAGDLLECFALYLLSLNGLGIVLSLLLKLIPHPQVAKLSDRELDYFNIGLALAAYIGASGLAFWILNACAKKRGASLSQELGLNTTSVFRNIGFGALGWGTSIVLMFAVNFVSTSLLHKLPDPENPALPMLAFAPDTLSRFALYGLAAIAAPFFEETFFRGVLLNGLLLRFKPVTACLITGLLFGAIHPVGIVQALGLASLGAVFAWMAFLRKSLVPSMFSHFLQNSYAYLSVYLCFALILRH